jgi:hypothetical protein
MKEVTAREGLVAISFERKYREFSDLLHFAKLYMLAGAQESLYLSIYFFLSCETNIFILAIKK